VKIFTGYKRLDKSKISKYARKLTKNNTAEDISNISTYGKRQKDRVDRMGEERHPRIRSNYKPTW